MVKAGDDKDEVSFSQFRSKAIVLAQGAHQQLHPLFEKEWFPFMATPSNRERVILADHFLRRDVYL